MGIGFLEGAPVAPGGEMRAPDPRLCGCRSQIQARRVVDTHSEHWIAPFSDS
jgi:hypothetical protein